MLFAIIPIIFLKISFDITKTDKKYMFEDKSNSREVTKSFQENLIQRLGPYEGRALEALGHDFFYLVDQLSADLYEKHPKDAPLLDLNESEFPWELQVFTNQFLRECAQSKGELTKFCSGLRKKLEDTEFRKKFWKILDAAYQQHFYVTDSEKHFLV